MTATDGAVPPHLGLQELNATALRAASRFVDQRAPACAAAACTLCRLYYSSV